MSGKRYIDDISVAEVNDYLTELYYTEGRAYQYVEVFLKMFYLIFGQAYSRNFLDVDTCNKLRVNKDVCIHMPKMKIDEDTDIVAYSREQAAGLVLTLDSKYTICCIQLSLFAAISQNIQMLSHAFPTKISLVGKREKHCFTRFCSNVSKLRPVFLDCLIDSETQRLLP